MPSGDFTQEAYQQLRDAYAASLSTQDEQELEGKEIFGQKMSLETLPVDSPWRDKIKDWQYPDGKSEYQDGKQTPDEILEIMRQSVLEKKKAEEPEELSDEDLDALLDEILAEVDDDEESEDEELEEDESEEDEDEEESEEEDEEEEDDDDEEEEDEEEYEDEDEEEESDESDDEEDDEEYDEEEEEIDPEEVASQIAELREQIESFRFANISDEDIEE